MIKEKIVLEKQKNKKEDIREIYLSNLTNQFIQATGLKKINLNSQNFLNEFNEWLKENKKLLNKYKIILDYLELNNNSIHTAEIGKGAFDTISSNNNITIITPYTYQFDTKTKKNLIKGSLKIVPNNHSKQDISKDLEINNINSFITQNPYNKENIKLWDLLYSRYQYNITIGVYGKEYDKDKEIKIKLLKDLKTKLNIKEEYIRINDNYFYIISSPIKKYKIK